MLRPVIKCKYDEPILLSRRRRVNPSGCTNVAPLVSFPTANSKEQQPNKSVTTKRIREPHSPLTGLPEVVFNGFTCMFYANVRTCPMFRSLSLTLNRTGETGSRLTRINAIHKDIRRGVRTQNIP